jgi:hypothetical protein
MKESETRRLLAILAAYWRAEVSEDTASLWSASLAEFEVQDGMCAARVLAEQTKFMPSLAELLVAMRECRNERIVTGLKALPDDLPDAMTLAEFFEANPDYRALVESIGR